jgi:thiol-disulfide isomerase/thioredoxin
MKYLDTQEELEALIGRGYYESETELPDLTIIWFTAEWCGPCKKVPIQQLMDEFPANWLKCDVDRNSYTPGYCNIRSIPTFLVIYKKQILGTKGGSNILELKEWFNTILSKI